MPMGNVPSCDRAPLSVICSLLHSAPMMRVAADWKWRE